MQRKRLFYITLTILALASLLTTYVCNRIIEDASKGRLYTDTKTIPFNKVGLLLGTSKSGLNGHNNPYYDYRIQAAVRLVKDQKIKYILVSGDNGRQSYNEPELMKADLIKAGVDSNIIYLDFAGFRTFDSIKRLKEVFGQNSATIISQEFHNERAIYIASREGIAAVGYNATDVSSRQGIKTQLREKFARVKVFVDYLLGKKPKYLGDKIAIPS